MAVRSEVEVSAEVSTIVLDLPAETSHVERPVHPRSAALKNYILVSRGMATSDVICLLSAFLLTHLSLYRIAEIPGGYTWFVLLVPILWVAVFHAYGLYEPQHLSPAEEFRRVLGATSVAVIGIGIAGIWANAWVSRRWIGLFWLVAVLLEMLTRRVWRYKIGHLREEGHLSLRTLVVGTNADAVRVAHAIKVPGTGFDAIGFVAASYPFVQPVDGLPVVGRLEDLANTIRNNQVECLFVASTGLTEAEVSKTLQVARHQSVEVRVSSNLSEILTTRVRVQAVGDVTALSLRPVQLNGARGSLKRAFDVVLGTLLFLLLVPFLVVLGLAVRLTSRGPALFRQQRTTKDGRAFTMYKFRTMSQDEDARRPIDISAPFFKLEDDPRLTKVGRLLRRSSLDELPQLINVIKGDLSLVGPRPLPIEQLDANRGMLSARHEVRAGMTGWWQIKGRSDVSPEEALRMDLFYIENWSLSLDLYILAKTFGVVVGRKGAK